MKTTNGVVRNTWLDGLFDAVLAEFNRLLEARGETHPRGPVTKLFEDAVGNVIKEPFTLEAFSGFSVSDDREAARNIFVLGVLLGQRLLQLIGLTIQSGTWLDKLYDAVIAEHEKLLEEIPPWSPWSKLFDDAVGNVIDKAFSFKIFSSASPADDCVVARNIFALGVLSGQRLWTARILFLKLVPNLDELQ